METQSASNRGQCTPLGTHTAHSFLIHMKMIRKAFVFWCLFCCLFSFKRWLQDVSVHRSVFLTSYEILFYIYNMFFKNQRNTFTHFICSIQRRSCFLHKTSEKSMHYLYRYTYCLYIYIYIYAY